MFTDDGGRTVHPMEGPQCFCEHPGAGTAGVNGYRCTDDGQTAYCASDEVCYADRFEKGRWGDGCLTYIQLRARSPPLPIPPTSLPSLPTTACGASCGGKKKRAKEMTDFYHFQAHEKKREGLLRLREQFEADRERIAKMRADRKFKPQGY